MISLFEQKWEMPLWQVRVDKAIYVLILLSSLGVVLETLPSVKANPLLFNALLVFEDIAMTLFIIELILRLSVVKSLYANCETGWERFMLFFYLLIDFCAVSPAVIFALGAEHHDYFLTLRLLRVFKAFRHDDSVEIVLRAVLIKKDVLFKTAIVIFITTLFLAVFLYEAENKFEFDIGAGVEGADLIPTGMEKAGVPTRFTDILTSIIWCFSMYVGDLAGYIESGFVPTTSTGKLVAGILGFLNIAIVVIPTGIIATGFLEVLEEKKIKSQHKVLADAFRPKYNPLLKADLHERPRTMFTLQNALYIHQNNLFKILETKPGFRLRAVQSDEGGRYGDMNLVEYYGYGELTAYGVKRSTEKASATVVCPAAFAQKGIGYFGYCISVLNQANLVSNERFQMNSLNRTFDASFLYNPLYHEDLILPSAKKDLRKIPASTIGLYHFKQDLAGMMGSGPFLVFLSDDGTAHFQIQQADQALSRKNDLLTWLFEKKQKVYLVKISTKKLDDYTFYGLINEVRNQLAVMGIGGMVEA